MMEEHHSQHELLNLINGLQDKSLTLEQGNRLNQLLESDPFNQLLYIRYMSIYSEMNLGEMSQELIEQNVNSALSGPVSIPRSLSRTIGGFILVITLFVAVGTGLYFNLSNAAPQKTIIGQVSILSDQVAGSNPSFMLNDLIEQGQEIELKDGIASLLLNNGVQLSLIGPAKVNLDQLDQVSLESGAVAVSVPKEAIGFMVTTDDAEIVDLGTEFLVEIDEDGQTLVTVQKGAVRTTLIDILGEKLRQMELTSGRSARLHSVARESEEIGTSARWEKWFDQTKQLGHGIHKTQGAVRIATVCPTQLREQEHQTQNHILLIREKSAYKLPTDLTIQSDRGPVTLSAGTQIDSYLVHYDPTKSEGRVPIGSIRFHQNVLAVISKSEELLATDDQFGVAKTFFSKHPHRGLDSDDKFSLSESENTLSLHLDIEFPIGLDQCRVLVAHDQPL